MLCYQHYSWYSQVWQYLWFNICSYCMFTGKKVVFKVYPTYTHEHACTDSKHVFCVTNTTHELEMQYCLRWMHRVMPMNEMHIWILMSIYINDSMQMQLNCICVWTVGLLEIYFTGLFFQPPRCEAFSCNNLKFLYCPNITPQFSTASPVVWSRW